MKKIFIISITTIFSLTSFNLFAQIGGNHIYQNNAIDYNRHVAETTSVYSTDSSLVINSRVLLNQKADHYLISIGVNQSGKTVLEANQKLNVRIEKTLKKITGLGIKKNHIYIDFISETKLYDHKIIDKKITEYFDGFLIRKNMIIKVDQLDHIDQIVNYCSEVEIYDLIKVDYVSQDLEKINDLLHSEALKIIQQKKKSFISSSSIELTDKYRLASEKFKHYYPKKLYKQYNEAYETSLVNNYYSSNYIKQEVRKEKTFYYEGIESEFGFDKIIDNASPLVGIQYVLEIQVIYQLKK